MEDYWSSEDESKEIIQTKGIPNTMIINQNDYYQKIYDYSELINKGSDLTLNHNYDEALELYNKALFLAKQLNDDYKKNEAICNIGIAYFYSGKMKESINNIQTCYDYINSVCHSKIGTNNIRNLILLCKSGANLSMCELTKNSENNNCISLIENIIYILSKEEDLYKKKYCAQYLNNILFRVNTLLTGKYYNVDEDYFNDQNIMMNDNEKIYIKINELFIKAFDSYIATDKIKLWLNSLNIIYQQMEQLNDQRGMLNMLFNQQLAILLKKSKNNNFDNEEKVNAKNILKSLLKSITGYNNNDNQIINEEYLNNVIEDYKYKILVIRKIYQILKSFEEEISEN